MKSEIPLELPVLALTNAMQDVQGPPAGGLWRSEKAECLPTGHSEHGSPFQNHIAV